MLELVVIGATLALAAGASGAQLHRRILAARTFAEYATSRKHVFVPAPSKPKGASPRVEGERDNVRFAIDLYRLGDIVRTRVATTLTHAHLGKFSAVRRRGGTYDFTADSHDLEEAVRLHSGDALATLSARPDVWLAGDGARITISWQGIETNPLLLDAACELVTSLATVQRPCQPYR